MRTPRLTRDPRTHERDLDAFGYCLVERALPPERLAAVRERLIEQARAERERGIEYRNPGHLDNQWVNMLINKGVEFEHLVLHPLVGAVIAGVLGEDYLLSVCDAQIKHPGSGCMPLHTDQWWMPPPAPARGAHVRPADMRRAAEGTRSPEPADAAIAPLAAVTVMWMITDFTEANGATRVVPGSHRSGRQPDQSLPHPIDTVTAAGPAGTALVFDGRLWHAAGANTTSETRYGITCAFCGPQFRPLENYTRGLRPEVMARASPELLRRLGFRAWSTYGHTGDPDRDVAADASATIGELRPGP